MEPDFSGYATKANLKCKDGRTILPGAFRHQDQTKVPLVWQHGHNDPKNVLGHAILENRDDGVYAYGFFNKTPQASHMAEAVRNEDITMMSIWANELVERNARVLHGAIREVSLVLSGANPGAKIENVTIRHSDGGEMEILDEEAIITTGLQLMHSAGDDSSDDVEEPEAPVKKDDKDETVQDILDTFNEKQEKVLHYLVGAALADSESNNKESEEEMAHNVFESDATGADGLVLSHADIQEIVANATRNGSLKDAVEDFALEHGIENIDILFPDAHSLAKSPEFLQRRNEWVGKFLNATQKSPFSRIKTQAADLTHEDARAKGYVKGNVKREEFINVMSRVTTPTTVYKKQKLDRDDVVDITDFDVVAWLKAEMRVMLDEEIARAALIGDGRDVAHVDKINEGNIRPIAKDHELFNTTVYANIDGTGASIQDFIDAVVENRKYYKGTGLPTMYTTETYIAQFLLLKDTLGRRIYKTLEELATELRVSEVVPIEAMEDDEEIIAIFVNPSDYVMGATAGGQVSMFDDFDIDYNQHKYLIETRLCGALTKVKSALTFRKVDGQSVLVAPEAPTYDPDSREITIPSVAGVKYINSATEMEVTGTVTVDPGGAIVVVAQPDSGYYFRSAVGTKWTFKDNG